LGDVALSHTTTLQAKFSHFQATMTIPSSSSTSTMNSSCSGSHRPTSQSKKPTPRKRHSQTKLQSLATPTSSLSSIESSVNHRFPVVSPAPHNLLDAKRFFLPPKTSRVSPVCVASAGHERITGPGPGTFFTDSACANSGDFTSFVPQISTLGMPDNPLVKRMLQRRREQQQQAPHVVARSDLPPSMPVKRQSVDCFETLCTVESSEMADCVPSEPKCSDSIRHDGEQDGENSENMSWDYGFQSFPSAFTFPEGHQRSFADSGKASLPELQSKGPLKTKSLHEDCCRFPGLSRGDILDVKPRQPRRLESQVSLQNFNTTKHASEALSQSLAPRSTNSDTPLRQPVRVNTQIALCRFPQSLI
jgi:hypothetical protein